MPSSTKKKTGKKSSSASSSLSLDDRLAKCQEELEALRFHTKLETLRNRLELTELTGRYDAAKRALGYAQESMAEDFANCEGWYRHAFDKSSNNTKDEARRSSLPQHTTFDGALKETRRVSLPVIDNTSKLEVEVCGLMHRRTVTDNQIKIVKREICDLVTASKNHEQNLKEEQVLCSRYYQSLMLKAAGKKQRTNERYEKRIARHDAKIRELHRVLAEKEGRAIPRFGSETPSQGTKAVVVVDEHQAPSMLLPLQTLQAARTA